MSVRQTTMMKSRISWVTVSLALILPAHDRPQPAGRRAPAAAAHTASRGVRRARSQSTAPRALPGRAGVGRAGQSRAEPSWGGDEAETGPSWAEENGPLLPSEAGPILDGR